MKIADILRVLANNLDHPEGGAPDAAIQNPAGLIDVKTQVQSSEEPTQETTPSGNVVPPKDVFLPPLQLKQELLKKAVGVENVYDDGPPSQQESDTPSVSPDDSPDQDIVARIKKLSGVPEAAIQELSNDEIFDD